MSGIQFEQYCAELLENRGWRISTTSRSRDRGVDLIARKKKCCVVIQCKQQASPVGIGAVREARLARDVVNADYAAVVSSRDSFTIDARKAAASGDVILLSSAELGAIENRIRRLKPRAAVNWAVVGAFISALLIVMALVPQRIAIPPSTTVAVNPQIGVFWLPHCAAQYAGYGLPETSLAYAEQAHYRLAPSCPWPTRSVLVALANDFSSRVARAL